MLRSTWIGVLLVAAGLSASACGADDSDSAVNTGGSAGAAGGASGSGGITGTGGVSGTGGVPGTGGAGGEGAVGGAAGTAGSSGTGAAAGSAGAGGSAGCGSWECTGADCYDIVPMPGSYDETSAEARADGYYIATEPAYAFVRKDLSMLLRWAACEMVDRFPGIAPLALYDMSEEDGDTPGTDVGQLRHPMNTFMNGNEIATGYFQTDGTNDIGNICGDGSGAGCGTAGLYDDGIRCTTEENIVDVAHQIEFLKMMGVHPNYRVAGIDDTLADDLEPSGVDVAYGPNWWCVHVFVYWGFVTA